MASLVLLMSIIATLSYLISVKSRVATKTASTRATITVAPTQLVQRLSLIGKIEPGNTVTIVAPFEGTVSKLPFSEGQQVERDQVLLALDTTDLDVRIREARSEQLRTLQAYDTLVQWKTGSEVAQAQRRMSSAQFVLKETQRHLEETRTLFDRGIVPKMELDTYVQQEQLQKGDVTSAEAELAATMGKGSAENIELAKLALDNAQTKLQALESLKQLKDIRAPFSGVLMRVPATVSSGAAFPPVVQVGTYLNRGQALYSVANLESLKVSATVNEVDINRLQVGQRVDITGDGFEGVAVPGMITSLSAQPLSSSLEGTVSYGMVVTVSDFSEQQRETIRVGMTANLSILLYQKNDAFILPVSSITKAADRFFVYRIDQPDKTEKVEVFTGVSTVEGVEILQGIKIGDHILKDAWSTDTQFDLAPGIRTLN